MSDYLLTLASVEDDEWYGSTMSYNFSRIAYLKGIELPNPYVGLNEQDVPRIQENFDAISNALGLDLFDINSLEGARLLIESNMSQIEQTL